MPDSSLFTPAFIKSLLTIPIQGRPGISAADSPYFLPNTPSECMRLNLQHFIFQQFFKRHYFVPMSQSSSLATTTTGSWNDQIIEQTLQREAASGAASPKRILDIGCGTGQWALDMAKQFSHAWVVGVDIVPPARPLPVPLPANFTFTEANFLHGLPMFANESFDFVHMRCLGQGIPANQWQAVINELARVTTPGGWIETVDASLPHDGGPAFTAIYTMLENIQEARGLNVASARRVDGYLRQATTEMHAISSYAVDIPIGVTGGGHGARMAWNLLLELDNLAPFFLRAHCWDAQTWKQLRQEIEAEFNQEGYQSSVTVSVATGQRR